MKKVKIIHFQNYSQTPQIERFERGSALQVRFKYSHNYKKKMKYNIFFDIIVWK